LKGRADAIGRTRTAVAALKEQYGLALGEAHGENLYQQAVRLGLTRRIISGAAKTVIPCSAELKDLGSANPCLIVPASLPIELLPSHQQIAVGGQVLSLARSQFTLPAYIMDAAWRPQGAWQGAQFPILVSIRGEYRYLVRPNSYFFRSGEYVGHDLDQSSPAETSESDLKAGRNNWGDDLTSELTVVVAEI
jgi:hypothetical protein